MCCRSFWGACIDYASVNPLLDSTFVKQGHGLFVSIVVSQYWNIMLMERCLLAPVGSNLSFGTGGNTIMLRGCQTYIE
jgi:hypothetical protein